MKKLLIVLFIMFMTSSAMVYANHSTIENTQNGPACVETGNVSVEISGDKVIAINYNDYQVDVTYEVWAYRTGSQTPIKVGGGRIRVAGVWIDKYGGRNIRRGSQSFASGFEGYYLDNVSVMRCN